MQEKSDDLRKIQEVLEWVQESLNAVGAEYIDVSGVCCQVGSPTWCESASERQLRAQQEMRLFWALDDAGAVRSSHRSLSVFHAWESRLAKAGYECTNERVGDRGVLHVFVRQTTDGEAGNLDIVLDKAAARIEALLTAG